MQFLVFIHNNVTSQPSAEAWQDFFDRAEQSGYFRGGSALRHALTMGAKIEQDCAAVVGGFMRFDADSAAALDDLLQQHPVIVHGGSLEIFEMPKDAA